MKKLATKPEDKPCTVSTRPGRYAPDLIELRLSDGHELLFSPTEAARVVVALLQWPEVLERLRAEGEGCERIEVARASVVVATVRLR